MRALFFLVMALGVLACARGEGRGSSDTTASASSDAAGGANIPSNMDPRCESLCVRDKPECADAISECVALCQARVTGQPPLCATCLLENANSGSCGGGSGGDGGTVCCPSPSFGSVLDCAEACAGSTAANPGPHPICTALCDSDEDACTADAMSCTAECGARVSGVSGICALCLLDRAHGGSCASSSGSDPSACCPDPVFPTATAECTELCM